MQDVDDGDRVERAIGKGQLEPVVQLYVDETLLSQDHVDAHHAPRARLLAQLLGHGAIAAADIEKRVDVADVMAERAQQPLFARKRDMLIMMLESELFQRRDEHGLSSSSVLTAAQNISPR